jgi:hypothetical protein
VIALGFGRSRRAVIVSYIIYSIRFWRTLRGLKDSETVEGAWNDILFSSEAVV